MKEFCTNSKKKFNVRLKNELKKLTSVAKGEFDTSVQQITSCMQFRKTPSAKRLTLLETHNSLIGEGSEENVNLVNQQSHQPRDKNVSNNGTKVVTGYLPI